MTHPQPAPRPLLVPIRKAAEMLGLGRTTLLSMAREGRVELVRIPGHAKLMVRYEEIERIAAEVVPA